MRASVNLLEDLGRHLNPRHVIAQFIVLYKFSPPLAGSLRPAGPADFTRKGMINPSQQLLQPHGPNPVCRLAFVFLFEGRL